MSTIKACKLTAQRMPLLAPASPLNGEKPPAPLKLEKEVSTLLKDVGLSLCSGNDRSLLLRRAEEHKRWKGNPLNLILNSRTVQQPFEKPVVRLTWLTVMIRSAVATPPLRMFTAGPLIAAQLGYSQDKGSYLHISGPHAWQWPNELFNRNQAN